MRRRQYPVSDGREYFRLNTKWRIFHGRLSAATIYPAKAESARHLLTNSITTTNNCFTDTLPNVSYLPAVPCNIMLCTY